MVNDPIADLLVRIQNASRVGHEKVVLPKSALKKGIAQVLKQAGYIEDYEVEKSGYTMSMTLAYTQNGQQERRPVVSGFKRISKPSRRLYYSLHDIKPVKRGYGLLVLSTPAGIVSGKDARQKHVGGEALFEIW